jgi:hypothetical protein
VPSRPVVATDDTLQSGQPLARAYIAQLDEEFAQLYANLIGTMENIVNNPEMPATARVNATKEMRYLLVEQAKLLNDIERRQDAQEMENRSRNLRQMVAKNPRKALEFIESELEKLSEFRDFVAKLAEKSMALLPQPPGEPFEAVDDEPF